jgi:hypothetical protein
VDCVLNSRSVLVTRNVRDFETASRELGFQIFRPSDFLDVLAKGELP